MAGTEGSIHNPANMDGFKKLFSRMMDRLDQQDARIDQMNLQIAQVNADALKAAQQQNQTLSNLTTAIVNLGGKVNPTTASTSTAPLSNIQRAKLKYGVPEKFTGKDKSKFEYFQEHCKNYLQVTDPTAGDDDKIFWVITYLDGPAHDFVKPFLTINRRDPSLITWLHNWDSFWEELEKRFGNPNLIEDYRIKYKKLHQTGSVQDYLSKFQEYASPLGYSDTDLADDFYDGLTDRVKEILLIQDFDHRASGISLQSLFNKALNIDNKQEAWKALRRTTASSSSGGGKSSSVTTTQSIKNTKTRFETDDYVYTTRNGSAEKGQISKIGRHNDRIKAHVKWANGKTEIMEFNDLRKDRSPIKVPNNNDKPTKGPGPMELDKAGKGKARLICNTCGGKGHFASECPSKPMSGHEASIEELEVDSDDESLKDTA